VTICCLLRRYCRRFISPHNFCKPIAKRPEEKKFCLWRLQAEPKIFLMRDSAPHLKENKECRQGCAGVFNAPSPFPCSRKIFEECNKLDRLENFVLSLERLYGLPRRTRKQLNFQKRLGCTRWVWRNVPFIAGQTLHWQNCKLICKTVWISTALFLKQKRRPDSALFLSYYNIF